MHAEGLHSRHIIFHRPIYFLSLQVVSSEGLRPHLRWVRGRSNDPGSVIYLTDKTMSTYDLNPS